MWGNVMQVEAFMRRPFLNAGILNQRIDISLPFRQDIRCARQWLQHEQFGRIGLLRKLNEFALLGGSVRYVEALFRMHYLPNMSYSGHIDLCQSEHRGKELDLPGPPQEPEIRRLHIPGVVLCTPLFWGIRLLRRTFVAVAVNCVPRLIPAVRDTEDSSIVLKGGNRLTMVAVYP